jgi:phosphatidylglycerophosphate synthase
MAPEIGSQLLSTAEEGGYPRLVVNAAHAFDQAWLVAMADRPDTVLTLGGVPAIGHASGPDQAAAIARAMTGEAALPPGHTEIRYEDGPTIENRRLRKRETPFLDALTPDTVRSLERKSYFGAYKGVTDLLTKYLWPEWALVLTRWAAGVGMTPNMVTLIGAAFCVAATFAFADGRYWLGLGLGLVFMVLDTVDGKLARCTITSSQIGNILDHGMDIVHPPFWYWFWGVGLAHWGLALSARSFAIVMTTLIVGYVIQRVIERYFFLRFGRMHIHVWRPIDSRFRLITARRNPNVVILFVSLIFARPDIGLIAVALWTVLSLVFHAVRLGQAMMMEKAGRPVESWLAG